MMKFLQENAPLVLALATVAMLVALVAAIAVASAGKRQRGALKALEEKLRRENERQSQSIQAFQQLFSDSASRQDQRQDRLRDTLDERLDAITRMNDRKLEQMRETVSEKLDTRLAESFGAVNRQLADVHRGLGEIRGLAENITDLKKLFGNVKTRGVWGEVQLRALLQEILSPGQYIENAAMQPNSQQRVEFAVRMPARDGENEALLPIDSKFPQEDFLRLRQAAANGDAQAAESWAQRLEKALLEEANTISEKYIRPPYTTDYAVMFLPAESLYAEAAGRPGLIEKIQTKCRVLVAGPATLAALLTSLRMGFRTCTLEKKSGEVMRLLAEVRREMEKYDAMVKQMRLKLDQAGDTLDTLEKTSRRISRKLKGVDGDMAGDEADISEQQ